MTALFGALVPSPVKLALTVVPYGALALASALAWHFDSRAVANANAMRNQAAQFKQIQAAAAAIAQQALQHEQAAYAAKATEANIAYQTELADAQSAAARYIAAHRVQPQTAGGRPGTAVASTEGSSPGVPANAAALGVVVSADDIQRCTDATTYALKAHDWANSLYP